MTDLSASSVSLISAKKRSTKNCCSSGVSGRRNARSTSFRARPWASVFASRGPTEFATSNAASVVASSQALEIDVPRSYPMLRSSGGNGVRTTMVSLNLPARSRRSEMRSSARCGGFHLSVAATSFSFFP